MEKRTIHFDKVMDWAERRSAELRLTVHIILYWGFSSEVWGKREVVTSSLLTTLETNSHFPRRPSPPFHLFLFPPPSHSNLPFSFSFSFYSCITFHADTIPPLPFHISQSSGPFSISLFFSLCHRWQIILPNSLWITTRRLVLMRLVARSLLSYQVGLSIPIYIPHVYHDILAGPHIPAPTFFHNILPKPQIPTPTSLHDLLSNASTHTSVISHNDLLDRPYTHPLSPLLYMTQAHQQTIIPFVVRVHSLALVHGYWYNRQTRSTFTVTIKDGTERKET